MAADRVAGVYAVVVDACVVGFPPIQNDVARSGVETADGAWLRDHISRLCASHRLAEASLGKMRTSLYARCRGFQLGAHE